MIRSFLVLSGLLLATVSADCSSGDTAYMCDNLDRCWNELGFTSCDELKYLCDVQGLSNSGCGGGGGGNQGGGQGGNLQITMPPRNITVPPGAVAQFACTADDTVKVMIIPMAEYQYQRDSGISMMELGAAPSSQKVIQVIDEAYQQHEGWYVCVAYGIDGMSISAQAYLEIRDICQWSQCSEPTVCRPDQYTGTFDCVCPDDCDSSFDPVCGSDCNSYFNECTMKKETCEKGLVGVTVASRGLCTFTPSTPYFTETPSGGRFTAGTMQSFRAAAVGTPSQVTYRWYYGNTLLGATEAYDFETMVTKDMAGEWRVVASNCHGSNSVSAVFPVDIDEGSIVKPEMQCCKVYGDPHIVTYDGKKYDYMGSCSYIISQDFARNWQVYGTYKACGDRTKQLSCIVSITVIFDNEVVQFLRMFRINYRGSEFSVPAGSTKYLGQMRIENRDFKYYIYLGNTGVRVMWDGMTQSETCVPTSCAGGVEGMCGNADCNPDNEFDGFSGSSAFGNSWVVGDPNLCDLEPSDGNKGGQRTRPCDYVSSDQRTVFRNRCNAILDLAVFANCLGQTTLDRTTYFDNCMFDSCSGLSMGGGCDSDQACGATGGGTGIMGGGGAGIMNAIAPQPVLDPACMMGLALANDCSGWGAVIGNSWREGVYPVCPADDDIANMRVCP